MRCPDGAALAAWVDGEVAGLRAVALEDHVACCVRCARAARAERQVKLRTLALRAEVSAVRPDPDLLSVLMTVPQAEHDRALRRAHRASCGDGHRGAGSGRLRVAAMGAGAAVWLMAAVWSSPPGISSTGVPSNGVIPAGVASAADPAFPLQPPPAVSDVRPAPAVAGGFSPVDVTAALVPAVPVATAGVPPTPLPHSFGLKAPAVLTAPAVPIGDLAGPDQESMPVVPGR